LLSLSTAVFFIRDPILVDLRFFAYFKIIPGNFNCGKVDQDEDFYCNNYGIVPCADATRPLPCRILKNGPLVPTNLL
jgi:hypothetical protein